MVIHEKVCNCCCLEICIQHRPNWSELDVIILIKELFHVQIHISGRQTVNFSPSLLKLIYRNKAGKAIGADRSHEKCIPTAHTYFQVNLYRLCVSSIQVGNHSTFDGSFLNKNALWVKKY